MHDDIKELVDGIGSYDDLKQTFIGLATERFGELDKEDTEAIDKTFHDHCADRNWVGWYCTPDDMLKSYSGLPDIDAARKVTENALDNYFTGDDFQDGFNWVIEEEIKNLGIDPRAAFEGRTEPSKESDVPVQFSTKL